MKTPYIGVFLCCSDTDLCSRLKRSIKNALWYGFMFDESILNQYVIPDIIDENDIRCIQIFNRIVFNGSSIGMSYDMHEDHDYNMTVVCKNMNIGSLKFIKILCKCCIIKMCYDIKVKCNKDTSVSLKMISRDETGGIREIIEKD
jgi:hypothetical protein